MSLRVPTTQAHPDAPPGRPEGRPARPSTRRSLGGLGATGLVVALAAGGPALRLFGQGAGQQEAALQLLAAAAAASLCLSLLRPGRITPAIPVAILAGITLVSIVVIIPVVGRFPVVLTLGGTVVAHAAISGRPPVPRPAGTRPSRSYLAALVLGVNGLLWWRGAPTALALAGLMSAAAIAIVRFRHPEMTRACRDHTRPCGSQRGPPGHRSDAIGSGLCGCGGPRRPGAGPQGRDAARGVARKAGSLARSRHRSLGPRSSRVRRDGVGWSGRSDVDPRVRAIW